MLRFISFVCCVVFLILSGCSKKTNPGVSSPGEPHTGEKINVRGSWELRASYGGNRAGNSSESQPGNGDVYTFINNHYEHYESQKLLDSGRYTITKSKGAENGSPLDAFVFNGTDTVLFILSQDTLTLNPRAPMYDGVAKKYVRVYLH